MNTLQSFSSTAKAFYFISTEGDLYAWGQNMFGGSSQHTTTPTKVNIPGPIASFGCGEGHAMALTTNSELYVWGSNIDGKLGVDTGKKERAKLPQLLDTSSLGTIVKVVGGSNSSFALSEDGTVYSWGSNTYGQLGIGDCEIRVIPQKVPIPVPIIDLVSAWYHVLAITKDHTVYGWGGNSDGELGLRHHNNQYSPILLPLHDIQKVAAGGAHSIAINSNGDLYIWGWKRDKNLGRFQENVLTPELLLRDICDVACGGTHTLALRKDGTLVAWGNNAEGQLGLGENPNRYCCPNLRIKNFTQSLSLQRKKIYGAYGISQKYCFLVDHGCRDFGRYFELIRAPFCDLHHISHLCFHLLCPSPPLIPLH
jgi:alpha-tubulin suppressor-like RCC1 family protein